MKDKLHIDIETYSSVDIKKSGAYKYVESPDFQILMIAYALNEDHVQMIDLTQTLMIPKEFLRILFDENVNKHAHNATFERICFKEYHIDIPAEQWQCSMIKSAYCGLPLSLKEVSKTLKLGDLGKDSTGAALINYFCKPCKATKVNGGRVRNFPEHHVEKWEKFKKYCKQDVEAEREVGNVLENYHFSKTERTNYLLDQKINDRGVRIDAQMAKEAVKIDLEYTEGVKRRIIDLTGIENPNSVPQLTAWLSKATGKEIKSVAKENVLALLDEVGEGVVSDVLKLRQKISRTSIKKYTAMLNSYCDDTRVRGAFQFYGANRTGRWAGRTVQLHNLPRNNMEDLAFARSIIERGDTELTQMLYSDVSRVLSELIRTTFIPEEGKIFAVADFSAIEARVISWLAGEQWRIEVFKTHGKIYEASAAMMFEVPIEEVTKGSGYRARGKVAELALGYQGAKGALVRMGGEDMGLSESEMESIVYKWRAANPAIVKLWGGLENAAKRALKTRKTVVTNYRGIEFNYDGKYLMIKLPNGRDLFYYSPTFTQGKFGQETIKYRGVDQTTKQWGWTDTYGGKLAENVTQAIARDLLAEAMLVMDAQGYDIVMHIHDEVVCEVEKSTSKEDLNNMCDIMSTGPAWAKGLPLNADGYLTPFYKKD